eukprot:UN24217
MNRFSEDSDLNCSKVFGCMSAIITCICLMAALGIYQEDCSAHLPTEIDYEGQRFKMDWTMGPGAVCLLVAIFLKVFGVFAAVIVPTPVHMHEDYYRMDLPKDRRQMHTLMHDIKLNPQDVDKQKEIVAGINKEKREALLEKQKQSGGTTNNSENNSGSSPPNQQDEV